MVEIIRKGTPYDERTFEIECVSCKALLHYKGSETKLHSSGVFSTIQCPECGRHLNTSNANDVTPVQSLGLGVGTSLRDEAVAEGIEATQAHSPMFREALASTGELKVPPVDIFRRAGAMAKAAADEFTKERDKISFERSLED